MQRWSHLFSVHDFLWTGHTFLPPSLVKWQGGQVSIGSSSASTPLLPPCPSAWSLGQKGIKGKIFAVTPVQDDPQQDSVWEERSSLPHYSLWRHHTNVWPTPVMLTTR